MATGKDTATAMDMAKKNKPHREPQMELQMKR